MSGRKINFQDEIEYKFDNKSRQGGKCCGPDGDDELLKYLPKTSGTYYYHKRSGKFAPADDIMLVGIDKQNPHGGHLPTPPQPPQYPQQYPAQFQQSYYPPQQQQCQQSCYGYPYGTPPCNPYGNPPANPYGNPPCNPYGNPPCNPCGNPYYNPYMGMMGGGMNGCCYPPQPQPIRNVCEGVLPMVIPSCNQYAGIPTPFPVPISLPGPAGAYPFQTEANRVPSNSDQKEEEKSDKKSSGKSKKKKDKKSKKDKKKKSKKSKNKKSNEDDDSDVKPDKPKPDPSDTSASYSEAKSPPKKNLNAQINTCEVNIDPLPNIMLTSKQSRANRIRNLVESQESSICNSAKVSRKPSLARLHEEHFAPIAISSGQCNRKFVRQGDNTDLCISEEDIEGWANPTCIKSSHNCTSSERVTKPNHHQKHNRPSSGESGKSNQCKPKPCHQNHSPHRHSCSPKHKQHHRHSRSPKQNHCLSPKNHPHNCNCQPESPCPYQPTKSPKRKNC